VLRVALHVVQDAGSLMGFSVLALRLPRCCKNGPAIELNIFARFVAAVTETITSVA